MANISKDIYDLYGENAANELYNILNKFENENYDENAIYNFCIQNQIARKQRSGLYLVALSKNNIDLANKIINVNNKFEELNISDLSEKITKEENKDRQEELIELSLQSQSRIIKQDYSKEKIMELMLNNLFVESDSPKAFFEFVNEIDRMENVTETKIAKDFLDWNINNRARAGIHIASTVVNLNNLELPDKIEKANDWVKSIENNKTDILDNLSKESLEKLKSRIINENSNSDKKINQDLMTGLIDEKLNEQGPRM